MQLYCVVPMRLLTYRRAFATVSRYLGLGVGLAAGGLVGTGAAVTIGVAAGSGTSGCGMNNVASGGAVAQGEAAAAMDSAEAVAAAFDSARTCGTTTTTASSRITQAAAAARSTAGENRFNWFLCTESEGPVDATDSRGRAGAVWREVRVGLRGACGLLEWRPGP